MTTKSRVLVVESDDCVEVTFGRSDLRVEAQFVGGGVRCTCGGQELLVRPRRSGRRGSRVGKVVEVELRWEPSDSAGPVISRRRGLFAGETELPAFDLSLVSRAGRVDVMHANRRVARLDRLGRLNDEGGLTPLAALAVVGLCFEGEFTARSGFLAGLLRSIIPGTTFETSVNRAEPILEWYRISRH